MKQWAFIIGGSGGMGLATAKKLASEGYNLFLVHRDRKSRLRELENDFNEIRENGTALISLNKSALDERGIESIKASIEENIPKNSIKLYLHALALGNVKPLFSTEGESVLSIQDFQHTIHAMGTNFLEWANVLIELDRFAKKGKIIGLTSEGSHMVGTGYAAVGSAKAVLENLCRYMAVEFAPLDLRTNLINAGVTDTQALRLIPNAEQYMENAKKRNPFNRLTTPEDVANAISLFTKPESDWINGSIVRVDGGEQISGWS